ncbi:MAG: hypothetical protein AAGJ40_21680 [Planctomycetota bacterium]
MTDDVPPDRPGESDGSPTSDGSDSSEPAPSCLPGLVAATLLMGMMAFILCAGTTWYLFQQRTQFAIRTLEGYRPVIEQSYLPPEEKADVLEQLDMVKKRMQVDGFPPSKASAVMERLVRLPIPQWGEIQVISSWAVENLTGELKVTAQRQIRRLQTAIAKDLATVIDINEALEPVTTVDMRSPLGRTLNQPLSESSVLEFIDRAGLIADRCRIESEPADPPTIAEILDKQLRAADLDGGY